MLLVKERGNRKRCIFCGVEVRGVGCQAEEIAYCLADCTGQFVFSQIFTISSIFHSSENSDFPTVSLLFSLNKFLSISWSAYLLATNSVCFNVKKKVFMKGYLCWLWSSGSIEYFFLSSILKMLFHCMSSKVYDEKSIVIQIIVHFL